MRKFLTLLLLFLLCACQRESQRSSLPEALRRVDLLTPQGGVIEARLVFTDKDQQQGLSGVKPQDFADNEGMLFFYLEEGEKNFWMPDTYFDLDIIYLDQNLNIVDIVRKLPHYRGRHNPHLIPRARPVWSRHALEMKSGSPISGKLKVGDQLQWKGQLSLEETEKQIRSQLR